MSQLPTNQLGDGRSIGSTDPGESTEAPVINNQAAAARLALETRDTTGDLIDTVIGGIQLVDKKTKERDKLAEVAAEKEKRVARQDMADLSRKSAGQIALGIESSRYTNTNPLDFNAAIKAKLAAGEIDQQTASQLMQQVKSESSYLFGREKTRVISEGMLKKNAGVFIPAMEGVNAADTAEALLPWAFFDVPKNSAELAQEAVGPQGNRTDEQQQNMLTALTGTFQASFQAIKERAVQRFNQLSETEADERLIKLKSQLYGMLVNTQYGYVSALNDIEDAVTNELMTQREADQMVDNGLDAHENTIFRQLKSVNVNNVREGAASLQAFLNLGRDHFVANGQADRYDRWELELQTVSARMLGATLNQEFAEMDLGISSRELREPGPLREKLGAMAQVVSRISEAMPELGIALTQNLSALNKRINAMSKDIGWSDWWNNPSLPRPEGAVGTAAIEQGIIDRIYDETFMRVLDKQELPEDLQRTDIPVGAFSGWGGITIPQQTTTTRDAVMKQKVQEALFLEQDYTGRMLGLNDQKVNKAFVGITSNAIDGFTSQGTARQHGMAEFSLLVALEGSAAFGTAFFSELSPEAQQRVQIVRGLMVADPTRSALQHLTTVVNTVRASDSENPPTTAQFVGQWVDGMMNSRGKNFFNSTYVTEDAGKEPPLVSAITDGFVEMAKSNGWFNDKDDRQTFILNNTPLMERLINTAKTLGPFIQGDKALANATLASYVHKGGKFFNRDGFVRFADDFNDVLPPQDMLDESTLQAMQYLKETKVDREIVLDSIFRMKPHQISALLGRDFVTGDRDAAWAALEDSDIEFDLDYEGRSLSTGFQYHPSNGVPVVYYLGGDRSVPFPIYDKANDPVRMVFRRKAFVLPISARPEATFNPIEDEVIDPNAWRKNLVSIDNPNPLPLTFWEAAGLLKGIDSEKPDNSKIDKSKYAPAFNREPKS